MTTDAFPTQNAIHGAPREGKTAHEKNLTLWQKALRPYGYFFGKNNVVVGPGAVIGGLGISSLSGLTLTLTTGAAIVDGIRVDVTDARQVTLLNNTFCHVYLVVTRDAGGVATAIAFQAVSEAAYDTFANAPDNAILLYSFEVSAGAAIATHDWRQFSGSVRAGSYVGDGTSSRVIELAFIPKLVYLVERATPGSWCLSPLSFPLDSGAHKGPVFIEFANGSDHLPPFFSSSQHQVPLPIGGATLGFQVGDGGDTYKWNRIRRIDDETVPQKTGLTASTLQMVTHDITVSGLHADSIVWVSPAEDINPQLIACHGWMQSTGTIRLELAIVPASTAWGPYDFHVHYSEPYSRYRSTNENGVKYDFLAFP